ncbi:MAG: ATP-binding protein [Methanomicrobiaceae archaeon]|nr:ATP-binding protein [Methanomicrobiaceae archaeon]
MKIVVASGKGGTGKSTFSANFAWSISRGRDVVLVDCDVEEPNLHLFFSAGKSESGVTMPIPVFDTGKCDFCGKCGEFCRYGAIAVLPEKIMFFDDLCHSCGGCRIICPKEAISETERVIGKVWDAPVDEHLRLITGVLDEGEPNGIPVIKAAKEAAEGNDLVIYDASPGTACPVIETIEGSDYVVLVTESTPFGLHDLRLAAEVVRKLCIPAGVVINRSDGEDDETEAFCREAGLDIHMKIPFDREIARLQSRGDLFSVAMPEWQERFFELFEDICIRTGGAP